MASWQVMYDGMERSLRLRGWRRFLVLFVAGGLAALAMPPFFIWPLLGFSVPFLFMSCMRAASGKQAALSGWGWAFGYFVVGLYWIANALLTDPEKFGWLIPFAVAGLPAVFALYYALAGWMMWKLRHWPLGLQMLGCVAVLTLVEWLRGWVLTGFPWNAPGYAINVSTETLQLAAWGGLWGATAAVIGLSLLPMLAWRQRCWWPLVLLIGLLGGGYGAGYAWLNNHPTRYVEGVTLRLVQANIQQEYKWQAGAREQAVFDHVKLSTSTSLDHIDAVIWPETAIPFFLDKTFRYGEWVRQATPPHGVLLTGAMRVGRPSSADAVPLFYNSLFALRLAGEEAHYDKRHLVPFGEFVPLRDYVPMVSIVYGGHDFSRGEGSPIISVAGLPPMRPLICYEAIFPQEVAIGEKAEWLLNLTNDAWFGLSPGPYQHFEAARMRAVELGKPMVRVANTGISGVVDPHGRVLHQTALGEATVIDVPLPEFFPL